MNSVLRQLGIVVFAWVCIAHGGCASGVPATIADASEEHEFTKIVMGTKARVVIFAGNEPQAAEAAAAAFARMAALEAVMSDYRPDSEAMRLAARSAGVAVPVSADLLDAVSRSLEITRLTGGRFDITVGPIVALWRQTRRSGRLPDPGALAKARDATGPGLIDLDRADSTITLARAGMKLDFGGIGKGLAAQEAVDLLTRLGYPASMVEIGGDLVAGAPPPGRTGWRIAIDGLGTIEINNAAVATSGDAEQFIEIEGTRYSHIVDPRTGIGLTSRVEVTVVAPDGATADALASALSVGGIDEAESLAAKFDGAWAFIRSADGRRLTTPTPAGAP